jgi:translation initiation factor 6
MHIFKTSFNGTPNVGLYAYPVAGKLLLGEHLTDKVLAGITEALGNIDVRQQRIAGTDMPGIFLAGNARATLVPAIAFDTELEQMRKLGINAVPFQTRHTCLGNLIVANEHGAIISKEFDDREQKFIEEALGVPALKLDIAGLSTPGAVLVVNGANGIIHRDATDSEIAEIEQHLQVQLSVATVNLGTPYLRAGIISNEHGFVVGDQSGGPEIVHIDEALGYLNDDEE